MNADNISQIIEMQKENYANRIGTTFGIFRIDDVRYNWQAHTQEWVVTCTKCGHSETVTKSVGWDWLRGKGRCRDRCKHCTELKRAAEKNEKIKKAEELEEQLNSVVGKTINGWFVESREGNVYRCICITCNKQKKLTYKQLVKDNVYCKRCDVMDYSDPSFIGKRYGNLTIMEHIGGQFLVRCDCGFEKPVKCSAVANGKTTTCGRYECEYHIHAMNYYGKHGEIVREVGEKTEQDMCDYLVSLGYDVEKTKTSGDYGVDLFIHDQNGKIAVQVKNNKTTKAKVGVHAVMEVYAGGTFYDCDQFMIISYSGYTDNAKKMADKLGVVLCNEKCDLHDPLSDFPVNTKYTWVVNGRIEPMLLTFRKNGWGNRIGRFIGKTYEETEEHFKQLEQRKENIRVRKEIGISQQLIHYRMMHGGMTFEEAINTPIKNIQGRPRKQGVSA